MRRSRNIGGQGLYDAVKHLQAVECELAKILYIAGIEFEQISDVEFDKIFFNLRKTFHMSGSSYSQLGKPFYDFTRKQNFLLTNRARQLWLERQIAIATGGQNG